MIVSESRPMDSKEAAQEKEMDPLPLLRNAFLADTPLHVGRSGLFCSCFGTIFSGLILVLRFFPV
jgi:hypothetical protein